MEKKIFGFNIDYESLSGEHCLVLNKNDLRKQDIIEFQVDMIQQNRIPGILTIYMWEKDLAVRFYYKITGLVSLSNYLKRQKISKAEFIILLDRILSVLIHSSIYLLNDTSFVLDADILYIDPATRQVYIAYLPVDVEQDINEATRGFIYHLILDKAKIDTYDNFVQKILTLLKEENFNLVELRDKVKNIENSALPLPEIPLQEIADPPGEVLKANDQINRDTGWPLPYNVGKPASREVDYCEPADFGPEKSALESDRQAGKGLPFRKKALGAMAIISIIGATLGYFYEKLRAAALIKLSFISIFAAAAAFLAAIYLVRSRGSTSKPIITNDYQNVNMSKVEIDSASHQQINFNQKVFNLPCVQAETSAAPDGMEEVHSAGNPDETVLLEETDGPFLKSPDGGLRLPIDKKHVTIGRNPETCDLVIDNKGVGRAHAEIRCLDGKYIIVDLDSRNGTFLNGDLLISNKEYPLREKDRITFADAEFLFCLE